LTERFTCVVVIEDVGPGKSRDRANKDPSPWMKGRAPCAGDDDMCAVCVDDSTDADDDDDDDCLAGIDDADDTVEEPEDPLPFVAVAVAAAAALESAILGLLNVLGGSSDRDASCPSPGSCPASRCRRNCCCSCSRCCI